ncbi:F0F1 ATP synthase subunit B family protein [Novosphingobium cyanobacteriorum]|uniref:ATP synthase subunit b n=1 Tax=Novosphingobium cyanobacteriorum TaxID=3024215 RepID=A0ABT6CJF7_9SPHN|nr:ATPase [Novosphingobium cyanobacteriorum]MDF8333423.1 ATPase [Novosphingobium cyanobacteriorum]
MPQIAQLATTYSSQVFWLLVCFGLVFFVVGLGLLPKVTTTVDQRDKQIADDLAAAEAARAAADAEEEAWRVAANKQRADAQTLIATAKAEAAKATDAALAAASARVDETVAAAEARIGAARTAALGEIEGVAAEAAQDIVSRIAGLSVSAEQAHGAVKGVLAHG